MAATVADSMASAPFFPNWENPLSLSLLLVPKSLSQRRMDMGVCWMCPSKKNRVTFWPLVIKKNVEEETAGSHSLRRRSFGIDLLLYVHLYSSLSPPSLPQSSGGNCYTSHSQRNKKKIGGKKKGRWGEDLCQMQHLQHDAITQRSPKQSTPLIPPPLSNENEMAISCST